MNNTKMTLEEAINRFQIVKNKPSAYDDMYDGVKEKFNDMENDIIMSYVNHMASLNKYSNGMILFSEKDFSIEYLVNGKTIDNYSYKMSEIIYSAYKPNECRKIITDCLIKGFGKALLNFAIKADMTPMDTMMISLCINNMVANITDEFINNIITIKENNNALSEKIRKFRSACYNRRDSADKAWYDLIDVWSKDYALNKGINLYVCTGPNWKRLRTFDHIKSGKNGRVVYFTNGTKTNIENIDFSRSFSYNNSEVSRY